mgnify:FL=1
MRAVITVVGEEAVGILSKVSAVCAENNVNIIEVSQSILQDMFCMIMMTDVTQSKVPFDQLAKQMNRIGEDAGLAIHVMHEDIFNSMHRI